MIDRKAISRQLKFMDKQQIKYNTIELSIIYKSIELTTNNGIYTIMTLVRDCKGNIRETAEQLQKELQIYLQRDILIIEN